MIAGAFAAAAPGAALAQRRRRAFTSGPLATNALADYFEPVPIEAAVWPPADPVGSGGRRPLSHYAGKTLLVPLWSETCAPCLVELPIFARLNARHSNARFEIVPIVTGSRRLSTVARAQKFLTDRQIILPTLLDGGKGGDELLRTVAGGALPCTLLIDREGRLRGRQIGFEMIFKEGTLPKTPQDLIAQGGTIWEGPGSEAFFQVLRQGALG